MKTLICRLLFALIPLVPATTAWPQQTPPPPLPGPAPDYVTPVPNSAVAPAQAASAPYYPPAGTALTAPATGNPYASPAPAPYSGPVAASPSLVLVPAPPLTSYRWALSVEALFLERTTGGGIPLGYTVYNPGSHMPPQLPPDSLYSDDMYFPLSAGLRLELSRRFGNDITVSATYWGLNEWSVGRAIYGDPYDETVLAYSPHLQLPALLQGLDDSLEYTYGSEIHNVELNTYFRLGSANPYRELSWLVGLRYVSFADHISLVGFDDLYSASEQLNVRTTNNLLGAQVGMLFVHGWEHFQWEAGLKFGLLGNMYHRHGTDTAVGAWGVPSGFTPYDTSNSGSGLSALVEFSLAARIRINENLWFRLGYQLCDITGLALAPRQLQGFSHGGNMLFDGLSLGLQATW